MCARHLVPDIELRELFVAQVGPLQHGLMSFEGDDPHEYDKQLPARTNADSELERCATLGLIEGTTPHQ
jgi:hypothetical protein